MPCIAKPRKKKWVKGEAPVDDFAFAGLPPGPPGYLETLITQSTLKLSLTTGAFIDTKLYAYSRRRRDGVVDQPKPLYANSAMLKLSSKYFKGCEFF